MGYPHLNNLTEEEKLERKKQQKRDAQKRYYAKNKDKYREYGNTYYMDMKKENKDLHNRIDKAILLFNERVEELTPYEIYKDEVERIRNHVVDTLIDEIKDDGDYYG